MATQPRAGTAAVLLGNLGQLCTKIVLLGPAMPILAVLGGISAGGGVAIRTRARAFDDQLIVEQLANHLVSDAILLDDAARTAGSAVSTRSATLRARCLPCPPLRRTARTRRNSRLPHCHMPAPLGSTSRVGGPHRAATWHWLALRLRRRLSCKVQFPHCVVGTGRRGIRTPGAHGPTVFKTSGGHPFRPSSSTASHLTSDGTRQSSALFAVIGPGPASLRDELRGKGTSNLCLDRLDRSKSDGQSSRGPLVISGTAGPTERTPGASVWTAAEGHRSLLIEPIEVG